MCKVPGIVSLEDDEEAIQMLVTWCDSVIDNKNHIFGLCLVSGTELLEPLVATIKIFLLR